MTTPQDFDRCWYDKARDDLEQVLPIIVIVTGFVIVGVLLFKLEQSSQENPITGPSLK